MDASVDVVDVRFGSASGCQLIGGSAPGMGSSKYHSQFPNQVHGADGDSESFDTNICYSVVTMLAGLGLAAVDWVGCGLSGCF